MPPRDNFEDTHAHSWEIDSHLGDSTVADVDDTRPTILLSAQTSERPAVPGDRLGFPATQGSYSTQPLMPAQSTTSGVAFNEAYSAHSNSFFGSNTTFDPNAYGSTSRQGVPLSQRRSTSTPQISGGNSGRGGNSTMRELQHTRWAKNVGLVTTRRAKQDEETALKDWERDQYKEAPAIDEHFPAIGYYAWPIKNQSPEALLGFRLETLDPLRTAHSMYIEFDTAMQCLVISSRDSQQAMGPVIDGVRRAVQHAYAHQLSANPVYIVVPPTATAMRLIVRPRVASLVPKKLAKHLELAGDKLTDKERKEWKDARPAMVQQNRVKFRDTLVEKLLKLEPFKGWMKMRVFLGHVELTAYKRGFAASLVTFETFADMVQDPRQTGTFDKKIGDGFTVMKLREKIIHLDRYGPVQSRVLNSEEVSFNDIEVLFVTTPSGSKIRIEAEIDRTYEAYGGDGNGEYQTGSIRLFHNKDQTVNNDKRIEITTIDVEREIDWKLEVITDNEIINGAPAFYQVIKNSLSHRSRVRIDPLGLEYPQVTPHSTSELFITSTVVKSIARYRSKASGYVIEIAIYRGWDGSNTRAEPTMQAAVSVFHPNWDMQMEAIEHTTRVRDFGHGLRNLFDNGAHDGIHDFLAEVEIIQGFLADVIRKTAYQANLKAEAEAAGAAGGF